MEAHVISEAKTITSTSLFRRKAGRQPWSNPRATKIACQRFENAWKNFSIFNCACERWVQFVKCSRDRNLQNASTSPDAVARPRSCLEFAHLGVVYVRCTAMKIQSRYFRICQTIINVMKQRQHYCRLLQITLVLPVKRRPNARPALGACLLQNLIAVG